MKSSTVDALFDIPLLLLGPAVLGYFLAGKNGAYAGAAVSGGILGLALFKK